MTARMDERRDQQAPASAGPAGRAMGGGTAPREVSLDRMASMFPGSIDRVKVEGTDG